MQFVVVQAQLPLLLCSLFLLQEAFLNYLMGHSMSKVASFVRLKWSVFILKFYCNSAFSDLLYGLVYSHTG